MPIDGRFDLLLCTDRRRQDGQKSNENRTAGWRYSSFLSKARDRARSTPLKIQAVPWRTRARGGPRSCNRKGAAGASTGGPRSNSRFGVRYRFWRGAAGAGVPVVAGASSGIQVIALRSYLNPLALLSASFVEFMTRYHLLLSLVVVLTELKGTATSFSPMPRNPPTPTTSAVILPSRSTSTSMISPILLSAGS